MVGLIDIRDHHANACPTPPFAPAPVTTTPFLLQTVNKTLLKGKRCQDRPSDAFVFKRPTVYGSLRITRFYATRI